MLYFSRFGLFVARHARPVNVFNTRNLRNDQEAKFDNGNLNWIFSKGNMRQTAKFFQRRQHELIKLLNVDIEACASQIENLKRFATLELIKPHRQWIATQIQICELVQITQSGHRGELIVAQRKRFERFELIE